MSSASLPVVLEAEVLEALEASALEVGQPCSSAPMQITPSEVTLMFWARQLLHLGACGHELSLPQLQRQWLAHPRLEQAASR